MLMRAYFEDRGEDEQRRKIVIPDTAHGTNPASVTMAGYELVAGRRPTRAATSTSRICAAKVDERTAGLMLTNPSTLGLFDEDIEEIAADLPRAGALMYYDGANLNAVCGISRPGDMGFDVVHINLHKTFSQPHGGGGPGGGPVAVRDMLEPFLPVPPVVARRRPLPARPRPAEDDRPGARLHRPVRRLRPLVRVHPRVRPAAARDVRGGRAERELPARAAARRLRPAVRPALHARVRPLRAPRSSASTASRRSTSPSG